MMETRGGLTLARVFDVAKDVGLDVTKLEADMKSEAIEAVIAKNYGLARKLGINGTPAFVIEEEFAPGAISAEQMKMLVASAREKSALPATN
jgi:protein-disulfide isomerase